MYVYTQKRIDIDTQIYRQTDRPTDRHTDRQTGRQAGRARQTHLMQVAAVVVDNPPRGSNPSRNQEVMDRSDTLVGRQN